MLSSPVKRLSVQQQIKIYQPENLCAEEAREHLRALCPDVMVIVAYGQILPPDILQIPKYGCLNVHASLLPRWRGAAPIQRAILAGDRETGVAIMQMDEGLDTGNILSRVRTPIHDKDNGQTLHDRLAAMGAAALIKALDDMAGGSLPQAIPQNDNDACYAAKLTKAEAAIDWSRPAGEIVRAIRGFNPWPVAHTEFDGEPLRIWQASDLNQTTHVAAGEVVSINHNITVATGNGCLELLEVQPAGGRRMSAQAFLNSRREIIEPGYIFGQSQKK